MLAYQLQQLRIKNLTVTHRVIEELWYKTLVELYCTKYSVPLIGRPHFSKLIHFFGVNLLEGYSLY